MVKREKNSSKARPNLNFLLGAKWGAITRDMIEGRSTPDKVAILQKGTGLRLRGRASTAASIGSSLDRRKPDQAEVDEWMLRLYQDACAQGLAAPKKWDAIQVCRSKKGIPGARNRQAQIAWKKVPDELKIARGKRRREKNTKNNAE